MLVAVSRTSFRMVSKYASFRLLWDTSATKCDLLDTTEVRKT